MHHRRHNLIRALCINLAWALGFALLFCTFFYLSSLLGYHVFSPNDYWQTVQSCLVLGFVIGVLRGFQGRI